MAPIFNAKEIAEKNKYMIGLSEEIYNKIKENNDFNKIGSYNIICARALGVTYAEFLRWARDNYNGTITGKGHKYPYITFSDKSDCNKCCMFLNRRLGGLI